jgi:hypothetical protein
MRWIEFLTGLVGARVKWEEVRIDRWCGMTQKLTTASGGRKSQFTNCIDLLRLADLLG